MLLISRQGKIRLSKFYETISAKERSKLTRDVSALVLNRPVKQCNFIEYKDSKVVYKRCVPGGPRVGEQASQEIALSCVTLEDCALESRLL